MTTKEDTKGWVVIARLNTLIDAEIVKGRLEAYGIDARLWDQHLIGVNPLLSIGIGGIRIAVPAEQEKRAKDILKDEKLEEDREDE